MIRQSKVVFGRFGNLYRKIAKICTLIFHAIQFSEPLGDLFGLKIGMGDYLHRTDAAISWIFKFLIFWSFLGIFVSNFGPKSEKCPKLEN